MNNFDGPLKIELHNKLGYITDIASGISSGENVYSWNAESSGINLDDSFMIRIIDESSTEVFAISELFKFYSPVLPEKAISKGDSWKHDMKVALADGKNKNLNFKIKYEFIILT